MDSKLIEQAIRSNLGIFEGDGDQTVADAAEFLLANIEENAERQVFLTGSVEEGMALHDAGYIGGLICTFVWEYGLERG